MVTATPTRRLLCLTMLGYKKPGLTEEELCDFQVNKHSQLVSGLMQKYGVVRYSITHNAAKPMDLLPLLFDPNYVEYSDHDFIVQIIIPSLESFIALKEDPIYKERVAMDHLNFADRTDRARRTRMSLGYVHEIIRDGQAVYVDDMSVVHCQVNNELLDSNGTFASA
ncbi:hypothetical protein N7457_001155 [Penicillium paradoxum]|uniref:uncharacterized protein n=1 Tax=Penicillium paradoxum TaxID=176176 RepID=UPI0025489661|nr:uncharacterized protein N7457_001155 [Penicillium paradoxum]KAJ5794556.1 hypothetical protein N7457_001155 [Penicillium paradoxum]